MAWTAPPVDRPGGSLVADEPELLRGLLDYQRATLLYKCAGLTGEQLALAPVGPSNLCLLGIIRHMAKVERIWFRRRFAGEQVEMLYSTPAHKDADFENADPAGAEQDYARLIAEQEASRRVTDGAPLGTTFSSDGQRYALRFVFNHMIAEYARHNGHADLIRECVDGFTGA